jgi:hypothetical protein
MGFLNVLSKRKAPEELPDLVIDEIKEKLKQNEAAPLQVIKKEEEKKIILTEKPKETKLEVQIPKSENIDREKSFFNKILVDINSEINDLGKLEDWYENRFIQKDIVADMKDYWEDKKQELVIKSIGKSFRDKINEKISHLQELEKNWQDAYMQLIEKEEELKKEEKELKKVISEFMEMCKRRGTRDKTDEKED